jgi:glycosyltransferase involved in cell wall biosynthesis
MAYMIASAANAPVSHLHAEAGAAGLELTVLVPCLNEARTVADCVSAALGFLQTAGVAGEVLVADNGSTDGSQALARQAGARVIDVPRRGYGAALGAGIAAARGRFVVMGDADGSYDFTGLLAFVERLRAGAQLVMGNRFQGGISPGAMPWLHRYLGNPVLSFIGRLFFRVPIGDFHCGLRGFSREAMLGLGLVSPGMEFASEMIAKAALAGLPIEEVPTTLRPDGRDRPPHLRTWRDGWRHLRFLLLFCPRWLFLYPGLLLLLLGLAGFALGAVGRVIGVHSLLYMAAATVLGGQFVQLALLTKWIGIVSGVVPSQRWLARLSPFLKIENGLLAGVLFMLLGFAVSLGLTVDWGAAGFGALEPEQTMRVAIPAVTLMILGAQVAAGSLFAGALNFNWTSSERYGKAGEA